MGMFSILNRFVANSVYVASAHATTGSVAVYADHSGGTVSWTYYADAENTPFQVLSGWDAGLDLEGTVGDGLTDRRFGAKTVVIKYDDVKTGGTTANFWITSYDSMTTSSDIAGTGVNYLIVPGDGFLMQPGDELVLDFHAPEELYACSQTNQGNAALSYMVLG